MANPRLSTKKRLLVEELLRTGKSTGEISSLAKVSTGTVHNVRHKLVKADVLEHRHKIKAQVTSKKYQDAIKDIDRLEKELDRFRVANNWIRTFKPYNVTKRGGKKGDAVAMLSVTDWHYEEEVRPASVNGLNEFNLEIAHQRCVRLWQSAASVIEMCRTNSHIDTMVMMLLGDFINGWIHEEYLVTNLLTPPEAWMRVFDELVAGIRFILKETGIKKLIVPCAIGNHGRITKRKYVSKSAETNWDFLLYTMLAKWFKAQGEKRVRFILPAGDETYIQIYNRNIRIAHGDNIRYQGGVGGVHIPLRKAIDKWDKGIKASFNYFGHWHQDLTGPDYRISSSLIGWSPYCIRIKAQYEPPSQSFELQHRKYGSTGRFPLILDENRSR
jgi:hypothetical protein